MAARLKSDAHLEIAHVLFVDVVGYSKLLVNEQCAAIGAGTLHHGKSLKRIRRTVVRMDGRLGLFHFERSFE